MSLSLKGDTLPFSSNIYVIIYDTENLCFYVFKLNWMSSTYINTSGCDKNKSVF